MKEEMEMLVLLREQIRKEALEFSVAERLSLRKLLDTCETTHSGAEFCKFHLAKEGNPIALASATIAGSHSIPSMAKLFYSLEEEFLAYLDKLISGEEPLLQR